MNPHLLHIIVGVLIGIACGVAMPKQPQSVILTVVLILLWHLTFNRG